MAELLLELFSEEIPARMQARAADDLARLVRERLTRASLDCADIRAFATPRRLTIVADGIPAAQPDLREERRGPRVGAPDKAIDGFLRGAGLSRDQLTQVETPKGAFHVAIIESKGRPTREVLADLLPEAIAALPWPKSMRWGAGEIRWVRPLHSILCLFDGAVVPFSFGHLASGAETRGHRFMAPEPFAVRDFDDYRAKLEAGHVVLDPAERRRRIATGVAALAAAEGLKPIVDDGLLDEVVGLAEWPVPLLGRIDGAFLELPPEVLTTSMRSHQKYFALESADGTLAPRFAVIANLVADDGGKAITGGNERVLRARLSDADFFWQKDRRQPLVHRVPQLAQVVFHARLGTVEDKITRLQALAGEIAPAIGADADLAARAAYLAKADLVTGMVGEFPELQGVMGRYYARHDGEDDAVAEAIAEHYAPQGPSDRCPSAPVSVAVALADKIDTLVGFYAIGETPTGSKDPFALRRAALGVIRLIIENDVRLPLGRLFDSAAQLHGKADAFSAGTLLDFFADRLKVHLRDEGIRHDVIAAAFALADDDLTRFLRRVRALQGFLDSDSGANLLIAFRRAARIVEIETKKDGLVYSAEALDESLFALDQERELLARIGTVREATEAAMRAEDFETAFAAFSELRIPVDAFFEKVTVNAEDASIRANRLRLLARIVDSFAQFGDFSMIEG
ncbi:glycine--tRNA ligase subunit beta [Oceanibacterium hippocampi]|uniref:Glycine--tRNA ligase beta subunit n=1 Tax=Oceanibacterium hippocampi TaxID=745714 RepID=A0A1Y5TU89_9PROT|nr:glycine--tRNA ligase subunit beta [Oceanibacterium hippocampi]SLN72471.1 Glycine--tRNA ligase beta subunit [Oceanibacterium hippocampi]